LPERLSSSPEGRQRFEREAKTISQLSHPHICALYDVGSADGVEYLVMELLEGETLSQRLAKGPLPLEQALRYGQEIADALDKAHRQGIVHRDLKPGNVMLTKSGVKLLDFGLAKALPTPVPAESLTSLPTQQNLTEEGTILGTLQYMAPEQLEGREADSRTDIFAFGCVLYEMATGKKAFSAASQASLITAIMSSDPAPISSIQPMTPPSLDRVVRKCLAKSPEDRWQSAADLGSELKWIAQGSETGVPAVVTARRRNRERLTWAVAAAFAVLSIVLASIALRTGREPPRPLTRLSVLPPDKTAFRMLGPTGPVAISRDGRRLVFQAGGKGEARRLYVRTLDVLAPVPLPGTENASYPFWSPDGRFVGFFADGKLRKIAVSGGAIFDLCDAPEARGGTWGAQDVILFAKRYSAVYRVPGGGGAPIAVTRLDPQRLDVTHRWPEFLPDGRHFLYLASPMGAESPKNALFVASLDGKENRELLRVSSNAAYASGHLLFVRQRTLMAQAFDLSRRQLTGEPVPLVDRVQYDPIFSRSVFAASENGTLVYQGEALGMLTRLTWFNRQGEATEATVADSHLSPRVSPDGRRVAVTIVSSSGNFDIWIYDLTRSTRSRLTFEPSREGSAVWSPDGSWIVFASSRKGPSDLFRRRADGSGGEELLFESTADKLPASIPADGSVLAFVSNSAAMRNDIWILPFTGDRKAFPLLQTPVSEGNPDFSPDGRWLAYQSEESGRLEVYVTQFPSPAGRWQISTTGGAFPRWSRDGRELFYVDTNRFELMAVSIETKSGFQASEPVALFAMDPYVGGPYDVAPDGRFLVNVPNAAGSNPLTVVLNWPAELAR
jgi:serine/threonine protein kinase